MFNKKEETKKADCRVKVGFSFYPDTNQILITYLQNCDSMLAAKYICDRIFNQIDVAIKLNETEVFKEPKNKEVKKAEEKPKEEKTEDKKEQTKEEKAQEIRVKKVEEMRKKREENAIKFIAILDREAKHIIVKNAQNCTLTYWVNYISWRVKDQATIREIAQATTLQLIESVIKDKKKNVIKVPGG